VTFDLFESKRDRPVGQVDSQPLSFGFVETSGLEQQVTDSRATDDSVTAKPATAKRDLRCQDKEAISVRREMLDYDPGALFAMTEALPLERGYRFGDL
jgi:hypothetical protein